MTIPPNSLILVADGTKMLFLRNQGHSEAIALVTEAHKERAERKDRDIKSGAQGLGSQGGGYGRPAVDESDFHEVDEDCFAAKAAEQLRQRALTGDFEALVLVAPPKILSALRKHLHTKVQSRVVMELPKDMINRPLPDIAAMLMGRSEAQD